MPTKITTKSNKLSRLEIPKSLELTIVNGLEFELDCQVETTGNKMTIWINRKEN